MNKIKKIIACIASCAMLTATMSVIPANSVSAETVGTESSEITPYTNLVFSSHSGYVYSNRMKCIVYLKGSGNVTIRTILQRLDTSTGTWRAYNSTDPGTTYNGVTSKTHTYYCSVPSGYSYRCKYILSGTVSGNSSTIIGFSNPTDI